MRKNEHGLVGIMNNSMPSDSSSDDEGDLRFSQAGPTASVAAVTSEKKPD
jgi:hypothetical protein